MNRRTAVRRAALGAALALLAWAAAAFLYRSVTERRAEAALNEILSRIAFRIEDNEAELQSLLEFAPRTEELDRRNSALYYHTLMKLYVLRADSDNALLRFVDAQIQAEIARAYDVVAWIYADISQIYIGFYTYDLARQCMETALSYAYGQDMGNFFYEYCYTTLAELAARDGRTAQAREYLRLALENDAEDLPEYQPMEQRRLLVEAALARQEKDFEKCGAALDAVGNAIAALEYPPMDVLWASGIYCPYMEARARLAFDRLDYEDALVYMDGLFAAGTLYSQVDSLMNFLADSIAILDRLETGSLPPELAEVVEDYTEKLLLEYPAAFQSKNVMAGTHIFNSNMATIAVFVQKYQVENFYRLAAECAAFAVCIIAALILFWRSSVEKSRIDGLTGAFTRKHFNRVSEKLKKSGTSYGVIMYDIDYFKQINDGHGHEAGDAVLRDISKKVRAMLGPNAKLYRYGGDEFCIICRQMPLEDMGALAESIRAEAERMRWDGFCATLSMGAAHSDSGGDVMIRVDENLYKSKEAGRNHVSW